MIIFRQQNLVYFAIPRTGTTALEKAVEGQIAGAEALGHRDKHINVRQFERRVAPRLIFENDQPTIRMAVLRDPLQRLESWYRYRRRLSPDRPTSTRNRSFQEFIEATLISSPPAFARIGDQHTFCTNRHGHIAIHHLFLTDYPQKYLDFLAGKLSKKLVVERLNQSKAHQTRLPKTLEDELRKCRANEFELYGNVTSAGGHLVTPYPT